jgi:hypothetical protein
VELGFILYYGFESGFTRFFKVGVGLDGARSCMKFKNYPLFYLDAILAAAKYKI